MRGLEWKCIGAERPATGTEISNAALAAALDRLQIAGSNIVKLTAVEFAACGVTSLEVFEASALTFTSYVRANDKYFVPMCDGDTGPICDSKGCWCDSGLVCEAPEWRSATRRWGALLIGVQAVAIATSAVLWKWDRLFLGGFPLFFRVVGLDYSDIYTQPWDIPGRVNSADATITVSVLSWVMLVIVVPWVMFHDRCFVVTQLLVCLGWYAMNVVNLHVTYGPRGFDLFGLWALCLPFLVGGYMFISMGFNAELQEKSNQLKMVALHQTPYRLRCCWCAGRRGASMCGLCCLREAGGTDSAQEAAAVVRYSAQASAVRQLLGDYGKLVEDDHEPPPQWKTGLTSVVTPAHWGRLKFAVSSGRAWKRDDKARTIASLAFSELTGSVGCKSGERAYWEVEVVRLGGCLRVGFTAAGGWSVVDCGEKMVLVLRELSPSAFSYLSAGDRVFIRQSGRRTGVFEFVEATEHTGSLLFGQAGCAAHVKLDGCGGQIFFRSELYQVVAESPWDVSMSKGDVIGLACDLDQGKLSWSLNGDWETSVSIEIDKVLISLAAFCDAWTHVIELLLSDLRQLQLIEICLIESCCYHRLTTCFLFSERTRQVRHHAAVYRSGGPQCLQSAAPLPATVPRQLSPTAVARQTW